MVGVRRLTALAAAVLALAVFNLTFRLGSEGLTEWDESLYATSALEMVRNQDWVATTFDGALDYSNSKPPLNIWLLALSLKTFGVSLVALRLASVVAAALTILVLLVWAWRRFNPLAGVLSAFVLATCFGFLYVHSGRTANPDAVMTLFLLLIVIVLDVSRDAPGRRVWLGPLLAGVFLLKGMAILMPLLLVVFMEWRRRSPAHERWLPLVAGASIGAIPIAVWGIARWQVDGSLFFERVFFQDFVSLSTTSLDGHSGSPLFYLNILVKHHYDWMAAALTAAILFPPRSWTPLWRSLRFWAGARARDNDDLKLLLGTWVVITLLVPTLLQTKLPWYLNAFYPMFALGVGWALAYGFSRVSLAPPHHRWLLIAMILMASTVAEAKLIWYSYHYRDSDRSAQGLLLVEGERLRGVRVFRTGWDRADRWVLKGLVEAEPAEAVSVQDFLFRSGPGEYFLTAMEVDDPRLVRVAMVGDYSLYARRDAVPAVN
jgi:4-amino-4-deoxy-L-arabinose transferase-like glycosyltransferase